MKKAIMAVLVAVSVGTSAFCMDYSSQTKEIFVDCSSHIAQANINSLALQVTPLNEQTVLKFKASSEDNCYFLYIEQSEEVPNPLPQHVRDSQMQQLVFQNPSHLKVHTDFANLDPFISTQSYHDIHNGGYHISANDQTYKASTFAFACHGAIKLNPHSPVFSLMQNPLLAMLGNHLSGANANSIHQPFVKPNCCVKSITMRPYGAMQRESIIDGTILYGDVFDMNLSVQGMVVEFTPNEGFQFNRVLPASLRDIIFLY